MTDREINRQITITVRRMLHEQRRTQINLAMEMHIDINTLQNRLAGRSRWKIVELYQMADYFRCRPADLLPEVRR